MLRIEDLGPKAGSRKQKRQRGGWRFPARAQDYPRNTIRWESLFVNGKLAVLSRNVLKKNTTAVKPLGKCLAYLDLAVPLGTAEALVLGPLERSQWAWNGKEASDGGILRGGGGRGGACCGE